MNLVDSILYRIFGAERTYSQSGEDKILRLLFKNYGKSQITYLDIGANHPKYGSNTYLFYQLGSNGVCVEPNPELCRKIKSHRPKDVCLNIGIGEERGHFNFYSMNPSGLSTFSKLEAEELQNSGKYSLKEVFKVEVFNINDVISEHFKDRVDLVSIDVEGWNEQIVESIDFTKHRPFCFCIETLTFSDENEGEKIHKITEKMTSNGYSIYADTYLNTIFIDSIKL